MNLVDEQHILLPERYQNAGKITCPRECRSARVLEPHIKFHGNNLCKCCLAQTRRAVEQAVVQRLFAAECRLDENVQVVPQLFLSYEILKTSWPQRRTHRVTIGLPRRQWGLSNRCFPTYTLLLAGSHTLFPRKILQGITHEFLGRTVLRRAKLPKRPTDLSLCCLLYTSDAADDLLCVDLGGR